jgi:tetratricopeptide (TPR) repeat protein
MFKIIARGLIGVLLLASLVCGCRPKTPPGSARDQLPFQDESQAIVHGIVSDLAEEIYYAASHRLPNPQQFSVTVTEKPGSPQDAPVYQVQVRLEPKTPPLNLELNIDGCIWSPASYRGLAGELARVSGLRVTASNDSSDTALMASLADGAASTLLREDRDLSAALEKSFTSPELHERAALLLGAFLLRDHTGHFLEIHAPLCRMTTHLAVARLLRGAEAFGPNGQIAEAILLSLIEAQTPALERLQQAGTNDPAVALMARAIRTRVTGDFRSLNPSTGRSPLESSEWFRAMATRIGTTPGWTKLSEQQKQTIDFVRIATEHPSSVEIGHEVLRLALNLEMREIQGVYSYTHSDQLTQHALIKALNEPPRRCLVAEVGGQVHVRVIGWSQWASFLQRHLCCAVLGDYEFMHDRWGVPEDAVQFATNCSAGLSGLRLYPFVQRRISTTVPTYRQAVDDTIKVASATPELVPSQCWNDLACKSAVDPAYDPAPCPDVCQWHKHNPPPGTAYNLYPRLFHATLVERPDTLARLAQLHQLAPYDDWIVSTILKLQYTNQPTYDQAMALFRDMLPYTDYALSTLAETAKDQPDRYEKLMIQAAENNPANFYELYSYFQGRSQNEKAIQYLERACEGDADSVSVANNAPIRVRYYLEKGDKAKARQIADEAGEVYSARGLRAKALFLEETGDYAGALEWYAKIEERYNDSSQVVAFCQRYKAKTGSTRFDRELQQRCDPLFPGGMEKVSLADFKGPPKDGILIKQRTPLESAAGLDRGDVIVGVYGIRVHNYAQYACARYFRDTPELDLIVWHANAYHEFKPSFPDHRFQADLEDYPPH